MPDHCSASDLPSDLNSQPVMAEDQHFQGDLQQNLSSASSDKPATVAMPPEIASWANKEVLTPRLLVAEDHHMPQQETFDGDVETSSLVTMTAQICETPEAKRCSSELTKFTEDDSGECDDSTSAADGEADDSQGELLDSGSEYCDSVEANEDVNCEEEDGKTSDVSRPAHETSDPLADIRSQNHEILGFLERVGEKINHKTDTEHLTKEISKLKDSNTTPRVIIAMVGQTGAGKSSLVNALLDVERVIPTSCSRACTAIITEIAWNGDPKSQYRAEFEFLGVQEWQEEVSILLEDLKDLSSGIQGSDSPAAIASAKMRAVYPSLSNEKLSRMTAAQVIAYGNIGQKLGKKIEITADNPKNFYQQIQAFVDSKRHPDKAHDGFTGSLWPVIRVGRIFMRSEVLSTGAVLVDLPGIYDCNAARRAIAMNYLARASNVCIVSNSKRAVSDKCASDLLGESLKRHLHFGGGFDRALWVNTHIDDVNPEEVELELGTSKLEELREDMMVAEQQKVDSKRKLKGKTNALHAARANQETSRKQITKYTKLAKQQKKGTGDCDPVVRTNGKRKRGQENATQQPIPPKNDDIESKLNNAKITLERCALNVSKYSRETKELEMYVEEMTAKIESLKQRIWQIALGARNQSLIQGIKDNYVATVQEFDEEALRNAEELDVETDGETRDYDKLRDNFAVFCTSSKGYQKTMGRMKTDNTFMCFKDTGETGIPELRAHITQLAGNAQHAAYQQFRKLMLRIVISLRLWALGSVGSKVLSREELESLRKWLARCCKKLDKNITKASETAVSAVKMDVEQKIYSGISAAVENAKRSAHDTQKHWGSSPNRESPAKGGLYWAEYKATVRRKGEYVNKKRECDFNQDLWNPFLGSIAHNWGQTLNVNIEEYFQRQTEQCHKLLQDFHDGCESRAFGLYLNPTMLQLLKEQLPERKEFIGTVLKDAKETIFQGKTFAYRTPVESIKASMTKVYGKLSDLSGGGQFKIMREKMENHVKKNKHKILKTASDVFRAKLDEYLNHALHEVNERIRDYMAAIHKEYEGAFSRQTKSVARDDDPLRKEILDMIESSGLFGTLEDARKVECKHEDDEEVDLKVKFETSPE